MSEAGLFQKCPSVDTHSGVTLQQTYYLLFCHFGFSTTNLGQDSISAPETSASLTITRALALSPWLSGCVPSGRRWCFLQQISPAEKKTLSTRSTAESSLPPTIKGVRAATNQKPACKQKYMLTGLGNFSGGMGSVGFLMMNVWYGFVVQRDHIPHDNSVLVSFSLKFNRRHSTGKEPEEMSKI